MSSCFLLFNAAAKQKTSLSSSPSLLSSSFTRTPGELTASFGVLCLTCTRLFIMLWPQFGLVKYLVILNWLSRAFHIDFSKKWDSQTRSLTPCKNLTEPSSCNISHNVTIVLEFSKSYYILRFVRDNRKQDSHETICARGSSPLRSEEACINADCRD